MTFNDPDQQITLQVGGDAANLPGALNSEFAGLLVRLVRLYANEADRLARQLSVVENTISALTAEDRVEIYDGANNISLFPRAFYSFTRNGGQTLTSSSIVLQNVTGITVTLPTAGRFGWRAVVMGSSPSAADIKFAYTAPVGVTLRWGVVGYEAAAGSTFQGGVATASGTAIAIGTLGAGTNTMTVIEGEITMGGTGGTLQLQAAQNTSDPGVTAILMARQQLWREV
jgi:hypothetical protein